MEDEIPKPGSTISLVSGAQVRYEGILEIIQMGPDESSITLANVVHFGTEGRPARGFIPPSTERFESICFKGADIVSLDVKEYYHGPPRQAPQEQQSTYAQQNAPSQFHQGGQQGTSDASVWGPPSNTQQAGNSTWTAPPATTQQPLPAQYAQPSAPPAPQQTGWQGAAPAPTVVVTPSMASRPQTQPRTAAPRQSGWSNTTSASGAQARKPAQPAPTALATAVNTPAQASASSSKTNAGPPPGFTGPPPGMQSEPAQSASANAALEAGPPRANGRGEGGRGRGRGRRGGRGRDTRQSTNPTAPPVPVPNEDFNFEDGLSKFDKDKIKDEADATESVEVAAQTGPAYNPEDDFFDALSSDLSALNTQEKPQRIPFSEQRKVDMETFGGSGVARRPMRGRGGRGRRGSRGRGGGGRNQSRPVAIAT